MERAVWVWQANQLAEGSAQEMADTLLPRGITRVYIKAMDGTMWMSDVYSHPLAPSSTDHLAAMAQDFGAVGLQLIPWVVPRRSALEAEAHIACGEAAGGVVVDFEYGYDGFWVGSRDEAQAYFDRLRAAVSPDLWIAAAPDARQIGRDYPADIIGGLSAYLPQNYWTDFKQTWQPVSETGCQRCQPLGPTEPILPYNADVDDIKACVDWAEQQGFASISMWRMGPADFDQLDAFGTIEQAPGDAGTGDAGTGDTAPTEAAPALSGAGAVPSKYRRRGWMTWPVVATKLEETIKQLTAERNRALSARSGDKATRTSSHRVSRRTQKDGAAVAAGRSRK
jgi:hypothetical protein